jgi:hypothetical protein
VNDKAAVQELLLNAEAGIIKDVPDAAEDFALISSQEDALLESLAQIERGEWISFEDLMVTLTRPVDPTA